MGIEDITHCVLEWVRQHSEWAALAIFVLAFAEFLPFVWIMLVGVGPIVGAAEPFLVWTAVGAATAGAAISDWVLYWLGHRYHERIQTMWPMKNHPRALHNGQVFFRRWGMSAIFVGRFAGPLRASIPVVAGVAEMPFIPFQIANWSSAFCWGVVLLLPGAWGVQWLMRLS